MPPHPLVWGAFSAPNVRTVRTPSKSHTTPLSTLLEIDNLNQSTLSVLKRDQTPYVVDLLAIIQLLPKGKTKTFGELSNTVAGIILGKFHFAYTSMLFQTNMMKITYYEKDI